MINLAGTAVRAPKVCHLWFFQKKKLKKVEVEIESSNFENPFFDHFKHFSVLIHPKIWCLRLNCSSGLKMLSIAAIYCKDGLPHFLIGIWEICEKKTFFDFLKKKDLVGKFFCARAGLARAKTFGGLKSNICAPPKFVFCKAHHFPRFGMHLKKKLTPN